MHKAVTGIAATGASSTRMEFHRIPDPSDERKMPPVERRGDRSAQRREVLINRIVAAIFAGLLLFALLDHEETAWDPAAAGPDLVATSCWFEKPEWLTVSCYRLRVPETRDISLKTSRSPQARELMLPVVVVHARKEGDGEIRQDPVVYLAGGPGSGAWIDQERITWWWLEIDNKPWLSRRDVILFDQRGSGLVEPRMDCPDATESALARLAMVDGVESDRLWREDVQHCIDSVVAAGHNAAAYTTVDNAEDVHDLFVAMNLPAWNVYGVSYGTRLALEYMRRHPADIRSVILDSVLPPQAQVFEDDAAHTDRAIQYLLAQCAMNNACNQAYPELGPRLQKLITRLDREPMLITRPHPSGGGDVLVRMDDNRLLNHIYNMLYSRDDIEYVPLVIDAYDRQRWSDINKDADGFVNGATDRDDFGDAMYMSVHCFEEAPFEDFAKANAAYAQYPLLRGMAQNRLWRSYGEICELWRQGFGVEERRASDAARVASAIPTLLLTGTYDPVTPPAYARMAARTLRNSHLVEFQHHGHDVLGHDSCANAIADAFLDQPHRPLDRRCVDEGGAPQFAQPLQE
jgi:pimeloyl-ACP methyl ester carboxylesterase